MKTLLAVVLVATFGPAAAGALQDCAGDERVVRCLERAKETATEQMLERFLEVKQALETLGGRRAEQAADALKQSQRAFERYVAEHCHGLEAMLADGAAPALACETDLLRQRATTLETLDLGAERI
jgi:uncharacterized protein YecT (DUF1311 family)